MRTLALRGPSLLILVLTLLGGRDARAKERFVDVIATHLALPYQPPCRVCHIQGTTGPGSVQTPFGVSMLAHGLTASEDTLPPALDGMAADNVDSDGDGVADVDELRANVDPNTAADVPLASEGGPSYGCVVVPDRRAPWQAVGALAGLLAAMVIVRRRSSPHPGFSR